MKISLPMILRAGIVVSVLMWCVLADTAAVEPTEDDSGAVSSLRGAGRAQPSDQDPEPEVSVPGDPLLVVNNEDEDVDKKNLTSQGGLVVFSGDEEEERRLDALDIKIKVWSHPDQCVITDSSNNVKLGDCSLQSATWYWKYGSKQIEQNGKCLDYDWGGSGHNVYLYNCHGQTNQQWFWNNKSKQLTTRRNIERARVEERCLDYWNDNLYMGWCFYEGLNQQFFFQQGGNTVNLSPPSSSVIVAEHPKPGLCLDVDPNYPMQMTIGQQVLNGYQVVMYPCNMGPSQLFYEKPSLNPDLKLITTQALESSSLCLTWNHENNLLGMLRCSANIDLIQNFEIDYTNRHITALGGSWCMGHYYNPDQDWRTVAMNNGCPTNDENLWFRVPRSFFDEQQTPGPTPAPTPSPAPTTWIQNNKFDKIMKNEHHNLVLYRDNNQNAYMNSQPVGIDYNQYMEIKDQSGRCLDWNYGNDDVYWYGPGCHGGSNQKWLYNPTNQQVTTKMHLDGLQLNKCLTMTTGNGNLRMSDCNSVNEQKFTFSAGFFPPPSSLLPYVNEVIRTNRPGDRHRCLTIDTNNLYHNGNLYHNVLVQPCEYTPNQSWYFEPSTQRIKSYWKNGHCLDSNPNPPYGVVAYPCHQWSNQKWKKVGNNQLKIHTPNAQHVCLFSDWNGSFDARLAPCHQWSDQQWILPAEFGL